MANVYLRNSRFEGSTQADIVLAPSAGNSVRRCVSVGSRQFITSPHHTAVNPATIQDCRIDGWTGASAISFNLRGPLTVIDNVFTNGSQPVSSTPMANTPWPQTNQVVMFAGNVVNDNPAPASGVQVKSAKNLYPYDLPSDASSIPKSPLTAATTFIKHWYPGIPTSFVEATTHGCTGKSGDDASTCAQATIDAAAAEGGGAAAYFAPGTYQLSQPLVVKPGNYSVLGSGVGTQFQWAGKVSAAPAIIVVKGGGQGLRLEQFSVQSGQQELMWDVKLLHDGSATIDADHAGEPARTTVYDGIYTTTPGGDHWNSTGTAVSGLKTSDLVHFIHLDGNLKVEDSSAGTVFLNFMIQVCRSTLISNRRDRFLTEELPLYTLGRDLSTCPGPNCQQIVDHTPLWPRRPSWA